MADDGQDWARIVERALACDPDAATRLGDALAEDDPAAWLALSRRFPLDTVEIHHLGGRWREVFRRLQDGLRREERWAKHWYLKKLGRGARWAPVAFHLWHRPMIERYCRAFVTDEGEAMDLAGQITSTFIAQYSERAIRTFPGYLQRMARTRAMRHARRMPQHLPASALAGLTTPADEAPDRRAIASQRLDQLRGCLDRLAPRQRELLFLRYGDELTLQAIGACQDRSLQAVDQEIRRLLSKISKCMKNRSRRLGEP